MIGRALLSCLLALSLLSTGLAATLAEARMLVAGDFCGQGPSGGYLVDHAGLPVLDGAGDPVAAPDCPLCTLASALALAAAPGAIRPGPVARRRAPLARRVPAAGARISRARARAPPTPV